MAFHRRVSLAAIPWFSSCIAYTLLRDRELERIAKLSKQLATAGFVEVQGVPPQEKRRAWERVKAAEAAEGEVAPPPPSALPSASGWSAAPTAWAARCFHLLKKFMAREASRWCMSELMEDEDDGAPMEADAVAEDTDAEDEADAEAEAEAENPKAPAPDA